MKIKWIKTAHKGLRYREHPARKHGKRKDRYYAIRFKIDSIDYGYGIGWWSDGIPEEVRKNDPNKTFEEYALDQLKDYRSNIKSGSGPKSPQEKRYLAKQEEAVKLKEKLRLEKDNITFKQYFDDEYYPNAKTYKKEQTYLKENLHCKLWLNPIIGDKPIKNITSFEIERIKRNLQDAKRSPRTTQYVLATARQVWNKARRDGIVNEDSPTRNVKIKKIDNRRQRFLNHDEANVLLVKLKEKNQQIYQMALLSMHTGMRASEIFNLTWECIDIKRGIINILDAKSGKGRPAFMTEQIKIMFSEMKQGKRNDHVFTHSKGQTYTEIPTLFRDVVKDLKFNENVSDRRHRVCFHSLRHTFASWHAEAGTDLYVIKELLGHGSITLTERYSHLSKGALQTATNNLEKALINAKHDEAKEAF